MFDISTKSTIVHAFIVLLADHRHEVVKYIFLYIGYIAATAESTSGRRFCALLEYVLYYHQGNEMTGDIRSSWVDVTNAAGPILLRLGRATEMAVFWSCFRDFVGAQKIEDLSESKIFFRRSISNKKTDSFYEEKNIFGG